MSDLLEAVGGGRYLLVNMVAKRARKIANEAEETGTILTKKPVSCAIEEIANGSVSFEVINN